MSKRDQKRKDDWQASLELPDHRQPTPEYELPQGFEEKPPEKRQGSSHAHTSKAERQEIFIPVSGFVWLYPEEIPVINHPTFQRLGRIYQLGQTFVVYRGATHKRLEHALGTLQLAQRMIDAISHTSKKGLGRGEPCGTSLSACEQRFVRLGALLHDIGHMAAGHTVEDELGLVGRHDSDARLDLIFEGTEWADAEGRTLAALIDAEFQKYVPPALSNIKASTILRLLVRKVPDDIENDRLAESQNLLEESSDPRLNICRDMIGNTICADLLDYIHRDWYHVGKPRPFDDRIFQYMEVRNTGSVARGGKPTPHPRDQFVISLGRRPKIRTDAVSAILELLEWRYQLTESVLFHRTKLAAAAMLDRALFALWGVAATKLNRCFCRLAMNRCSRHAKNSQRKEKKRREAKENGNGLLPPPVF